MNDNILLSKIFSYISIFLFISIIVPLRLFPCFVSGFLTYEIILLLTSLFEKIVGRSFARWISVIFVALSFITIMIIGISGLIKILISDSHLTADLILKINCIISNLKNRLPDYISSFFPRNEEELMNWFFSIFETNIVLIHQMGRNLLHGLITIFIGFIIGSVISLQKSPKYNTHFTEQLLLRVRSLSLAFRNIVFAQVKISIINTILTSMIILLVFPYLDIHIPFRKVIILCTFLLGLFPIIGNLVSNIIIIVTTSSISLIAGGIMTVYLVLIHKLEYFLNAEIIGNKIDAKLWELLLAMLILESIFGLEGLVIAPIYYAYLKIELRELNIVY